MVKGSGWWGLIRMINSSEFWFFLGPNLSTNDDISSRLKEYVKGMERSRIIFTG
jgi:hypothetical protein